MQNPFEQLSKQLIEAIREEMQPIKDELRIVKDRLAKVNKYMAYPDWVGQKDALAIMGVSYTLLQRAVNDGMIRAKAMSESGNKRIYNKQDCLEWAERRAGLISSLSEEMQQNRKSSK